MPRTKQFEPIVVLESAMNLYWEKGYEHTSLNDLLKVMKIPRQSLYNTFGDKRNLFIKTLEHYQNARLAEMKPLYNVKISGMDAIRTYFELTLKNITFQNLKQACFMANTAMELAFQDEEIINLVKMYMEITKNSFLRALTRAKDHGELSTHLDLDSTAKYLTTLLHGLGIMAKCGAPKEDLGKIVNTSLAKLEK